MSATLAPNKKVRKRCLIIEIGVEILQIEVTTKCNLNCPHCYYYESGESGNDYNDYVSHDVIDKLLDDMGIAYINTLSFTGGEPLLNEEAIIYTLKQILKKKKYVFGIDIATNGTVLSEHFANELNNFSKEMYNFLSSSENEIVKRKMNMYTDEFMSIEKCTVSFRISRYFHNNNPEKAYEFYKNRMPNVYVEIMDHDVNDTEFEKKFIFADENGEISMGYSGRAKNLNFNFYCDSANHKIIYNTEPELEIKCPLMVHYDGKISIAAMIARRYWNDNIVGNIYDGKTLKDMVDEWNYRSPLTCKEACNLEEVRMLYEKNRTKYVSNILKKEEYTKEDFTKEDLESLMNMKEYINFFLENYRKILHEKVPLLTPDELEEMSILALELEEKDDMTLSEREKANEDMDNKIAKMVYEHLFDDVKKIHKEFPYLTHDECKQMEECYRITKGSEGNGIMTLLANIPHIALANKLIELNEYRSKNVESIF